MWCPKCQADVAGEVTSDHKRVRCAICSTEISRVSASTAADKTREARELLERWSSGRISESTSPTSLLTSGTPLKSVTELTPSLPTATPVAPEMKPATVAENSSAKAATRPHFRVDQRRAVRTTSTPQSTPAAAPTQSARPQFQPQPRQSTRRLDRAHEYAGPHFEIPTAVDAPRRRGNNWSSIIGQLLAYAGVAMLTVGTVLVIWGYFGGPMAYTPTGWLIATVGQMLLFLGIVTIVSGGMEHTTQEVCRRIDFLGDRILRVEQASRNQALRGPSIPAEQFEKPSAVEDAEVRETARHA